MELGTSILKTLAYFDLFGLPLSAAEVRSYLYRESSGDAAVGLPQVMDGLDRLAGEGRVENHEAFYTLPGRGSGLVTDRKLRQADAMEMLCRNRRWFSILAAWPDVQAIAVCNSLAFLNAGEQSDIDLFIVIRPGRLWLTRFVLAGLLQLAAKRPRPGQERGTICLSFFAASDHLDLSSIALKDGDVYLSYWLAALLPVYDPAGLIAQTQKDNAHLMQTSRPSDAVLAADIWQARTSGWLGVLRAIFYILAVLLSPFAGLLKRWQQRRFPGDIIEAAKRQDGHVVITDEMLKFHINDRRAHYREEWLKLCR